MCRHGSVHLGVLEARKSDWPKRPDAEVRGEAPVFELRVVHRIHQCVGVGLGVDVRREDSGGPLV
jgi:hypothetical protein